MIVKINKLDHQGRGIFHPAADRHAVRRCFEPEIDETRSAFVRVADLVPAYPERRDLVEDRAGPELLCGVPDRDDSSSPDRIEDLPGIEDCLGYFTTRAFVVLPCS